MPIQHLIAPKGNILPAREWPIPTKITAVMEVLILFASILTAYSVSQWIENALIHRQELDLVLLDLMLKRTNLIGYDIFDQIQADPALAHIPVVLVTAADPDVELIVARAKGFKGFISKPLNRITFPDQIANILRGEEVWDIG